MDSDHEEEDEFLFESAHLAFRDNPDYLMLMRHLTILCAKRIQVHNDIEKLTASQQKATENPLLFVDQIRQGSLNLPLPIEIPKIPNVDLTKYGVNEDIERLNNSEDPVSNTDDLSGKSQSVKFWTDNEQRRLEELLHEFPPEPVESQRYEKIARAMGNRTKAQIASRVQKFFKKLNEANLPIPGISYKSLRNRNNKSFKQRFKLERPSTFFPERNIPNDLIMKESSDTEVDVNISRTNKCVDDHQKVLYFLKRIRNLKQEVIHSSTSGYECILCKEELFVGVRWHCNTCENLINYCSDCLTSQLLENNFTHLNHDFQLD